MGFLGAPIVVLIVVNLVGRIADDSVTGVSFPGELR